MIGRENVELVVGAELGLKAREDMEWKSAGKRGPVEKEKRRGVEKRGKIGNS